MLARLWEGVPERRSQQGDRCRPSRRWHCRYTASVSRRPPTAASEAEETFRPIQVLHCARHKRARMSTRLCSATHSATGKGGGKEVSESLGSGRRRTWRASLRRASRHARPTRMRWSFLQVLAAAMRSDILPAPALYGYDASTRASPVARITSSGSRSKVLVLVQLCRLHGWMDERIDGGCLR